MEWVAIITALLQLFGPILQDWLEKCTEEKLNDAAQSLPSADSFASEAAAVEALFDEAIANTPRLAFLRRAALRRMKAAAVKDGVVRREPLTAAEIEEGRDLIRGIRREI